VCAGWQNREVPLEPESWSLIPDHQAGPAGEVEEAEFLEAIRLEITGSLTPYQREVLLALAVNGVPIDVLAERLNTTRGALYKTLHDARRKLRSALAQRGFSLSEAQGRE